MKKWISWGETDVWTQGYKILLLLC
uniref:Uncharacterized protein n=1 Tax=Arundo donax TaxID=35708 RepID=A0A0A9EMY1_ARUDO